MRAKVLSLRVALLLAAVSAEAQGPGAPPSPAPTPAGQPLTLTQTPAQATFNGSAMIEKPVPRALNTYHGDTEEKQL